MGTILDILRAERPYWMYWHNIRYEIFWKRKERLQMWIAWLLPKWLAHWAFIRVAAHATTGEHCNQIVPELTVLEALERWEK